MSCPSCGNAASPRYRPFCSRRCADIDLAKWLNGSYAVPSKDPDDVDAAVDASEQASQKPH